MTNELATISPEIVSSIVLTGDIKALTPEQKVQYYDYRCRQAGLDPAAKPFDLLVLQGKAILYCNAGGTQQLCAVHKLSTAITHREKVDDIYCVSARVTGPDGRATENMGSVSLIGLKGEALGNAMMKATTKAIRRTVLSHVGLGMMDETEVDTIPGAHKMGHDAAVNLGFDKPALEFKLMMPEGSTGTAKVYAEYATLSEWADGWQTLVDRLQASEKLTEDGKVGMLRQMELHNSNNLNKVKEMVEEI